MIHSLRDFPKCFPIWKSIKPSDLMMEFFTSVMKDWIHLNLNCRNLSNKGWRDFWIIACHTLWSWRNLEENDNNYVRTLNPIFHIYKRKQDYENVIITPKHCHDEEGSSMFIGLKPPTISMWKINTNVASKGS